MKNPNFSFLLFFFCALYTSCSTGSDEQETSTDSKASEIVRLIAQDSATGISLPKEIWAIHHDVNDNYWFGSKNNGLYRYDGLKLDHFTTLAGLAGNSVREIQEKEGVIYIETSGGVSKYENGQFTTLPLDSSKTQDWQLSANDLWFSCNAFAKDVYRLNGDVLQLLQLPRQDLTGALGLSADDVAGNFGYNEYSVFGVEKDDHGNLWLGTFTACAFMYNGEKFTWFGETELSTLPDGRVPGVRAMPMDKDGNYWLSNIKHKYQLNPDGSYTKLPGIDLSKHDVNIGLPYFMSSVRDQKGNLWMVTYGDGIWKWDGEHLDQTFLEKNGKEVLLICIHEDRDGVLWLGTDTNGVWKMENGEWFQWE
ncbi:MAG: two-component regulator propeller domain-containing protein [Bacteroidota bacterium]